ncbi:MAG: sensor histidine kinase, partial [Flavobacterium sp.]|nr:sensor histidine kinase [Flavobacterium sp.]
DFDFKNNIKNNAQLTSKQGINIFRVLQESVNNAVKYASPSKITIEMNEIEKQLTMQIQDNGNGFNYQEKKKKSYGLTNMKNRIEEINGNFDLSSNDDGTIINIKIPLEK